MCALASACSCGTMALAAGPHSITTAFALSVRAVLRLDCQLGGPALVLSGTTVAPSALASASRYPCWPFRLQASISELIGKVTIFLPLSAFLALTAGPGACHFGAVCALATNAFS